MLRKHPHRPQSLCPQDKSPSGLTTSLALPLSCEPLGPRWPVPNSWVSPQPESGENTCNHGSCGQGRGQCRGLSGQGLGLRGSQFGGRWKTTVPRAPGSKLAGLSAAPDTQRGAPKKSPAVTPGRPSSGETLTEGHARAGRGEVSGRAHHPSLAHSLCPSPSLCHCPSKILTFLNRTQLFGIDPALESIPKSCLGLTSWLYHL